MGTEAIQATDEFMHEPTDHPQFNESAYYNLVDNDSGFGVLIRMGNRVNEGYAEVTVLVYRPTAARRSGSTGRRSPRTTRSTRRASRSPSSSRSRSWT